MFSTNSHYQGTLIIRIVQHLLTLGKTVKELDF